GQPRRSMPAKQDPNFNTGFGVGQRSTKRCGESIERAVEPMLVVSAGCLHGRSIGPRRPIQGVDSPGRTLPEPTTHFRNFPPPVNTREKVLSRFSPFAVPFL